MHLFDLQIQTTASDGRHSPREIVKMAKDLGIQTVAITDHDAVAGVEEALLAGVEYGVRVIVGVEMSVEENGSHILGFGVNFRNQEFLKTLEELREGRIQSLKKLVENLQKNEGFAVEWDDVLREAGGATTIASPHVVYAVLHRPENKEKLAQDSVREKFEFYKKYLGSDRQNHVKRSHMSAQKAIAMIHGAGGVAIWSHPALNFQENYEGLEDFLKELIKYGLDGIEVFNPSHTEDDVEFLESLSNKYNLLRTGGSDFHDAGTHTRNEKGLHSADTLGDYETYGFSTADIISKLSGAIETRNLSSGS